MSLHWSNLSQGLSPSVVLLTTAATAMELESLHSFLPFSQKNNDTSHSSYPLLWNCRKPGSGIAQGCQSEDPVWARTLAQWCRHRYWRRRRHIYWTWLSIGEVICNYTGLQELTDLGGGSVPSGFAIYEETRATVKSQQTKIQSLLVSCLSIDQIHFSIQLLEAKREKQWTSQHEGIFQEMVWVQRIFSLLYKT